MMSKFITIKSGNAVYVRVLMRCVHVTHRTQFYLFTHGE